MRFTATKPADLISLDAIKAHLRVDGTADDAVLTGMILAAVANAEKSMGCSLLTRTITATFAGGEELRLPSGPVQAVQSVSVGGIAIGAGAYSRLTVGTCDYIRLISGHNSPQEVVVVYTAGYGDTEADVPADITAVVKCLAGLLFENRELATDRTFTPVPFISDFFKLHSREIGVG